MGSEKELAAKVVDWLHQQHWEVFQEVQINSYSKIADIMARRGGLVWVIECKRAFSLGVMEQAARWMVPFRSVAVPRPKNWTTYQTRGLLARNYFNLGVILVGPGKRVEQEENPPIMRQYYEYSKKHIVPKLVPEMKYYAQAGTRSGDTYSHHFTPYRQTMITVQRLIGQHPGISLKQIIDEIGQAHYQTPASARASLKKALETYESSWCLVEYVDGRIPTYYIKDESDGK